MVRLVQGSMVPQNRSPSRKLKNVAKFRALLPHLSNRARSAKFEKYDKIGASQRKLQKYGNNLTKILLASLRRALPKARLRSRRQAGSYNRCYPTAT